MIYIKKIIFILFLFLFIPSSVHASLLDTIQSSVTQLLTNATPTPLPFVIKSSISDPKTLQSITSAKSGDAILFNFMITNNSATTYKYSTLTTNLNSQNLYYIRNVKGAMSVETKNNTITFPNLVLAPQQTIEISFEANIMKDLTADVLLGVQPQFLNSKSQKIMDSSRKTLKVSKELNKKPPSTSNKRMGVTN